jgi:adenylate cyclase
MKGSTGMGIAATVVITDLHGSTAVFEAQGNARATEIVTHITNEIAQAFESSGGRVVKTMGDGVLAIFASPQNAVNAVVELQRSHLKRGAGESVGQHMPMRIGVASGEVEMVADDCYGDAVNVASRLCDLCGPHQIWSTSAALNTVEEWRGVTFRTLGSIAIRGRAEPCSVYQIEWRQEEYSDFLTMQGQFSGVNSDHDMDALGREIELKWVDRICRFKSFELPVNIGRVRTVEFVVDDPRVSRTHARLEWRNGSVVLVDLSSYGSWVRFAGSKGADVLLRREECVLHGKGELALGASFSDATVPTVHFSVV